MICPYTDIGLRQHGQHCYLVDSTFHIFSCRGNVNKFFQLTKRSCHVWCDIMHTCCIMSVPHLVLVVDDSTSIQQPFNCLCVSILCSYSQRNRAGGSLGECMERSSMWRQLSAQQDNFLLRSYPPAGSPHILCIYNHALYAVMSDQCIVLAHCTHARDGMSTSLPMYPAGLVRICSTVQ